MTETQKTTQPTIPGDQICGFMGCENSKYEVVVVQFPDDKIFKFNVCEYHCFYWPLMSKISESWARHRLAEHITKGQIRGVWE